MLRRIIIYLKEMFPLNSLLGSILVGVAVQLIFIRLAGFPPGFEFKLLIPAIVVTLVSLLIRVMDEFKDYTDDLKHFPERPLPSQRVLRKDLYYLAGFCVAGIFFLSLRTFNLFFWATIILGYTFLMLKWFFVEEKMRKSLPLAFVTHHPIVLLNFIYLVVACIDFYPIIHTEKALLVLPLCLIFTNWEISRKIKEPGKETEYTTYSKIWGARNATWLAIALQGIVIVCMLSIFSILNTPNVLRIAFIVCEGALLRPYVKFIKTLILTGSLKQNAETQILAIIGFLLVTAFL